MSRGPLLASPNVSVVNAAIELPIANAINTLRDDKQHAVGDSRDAPQFAAAVIALRWPISWPMVARTWL